MQLDNTFTVATDPETAWKLLTDIPRIAPCLPGAKLTGSDGAVHQGKVSIKVGPVTSRFEGTAEMTTLEHSSWHAEITARGRDPRGGNADALIKATLVPVAEGTEVQITTDLRVTGKVAQFGKGMMMDVSEKLMGQFADCLAAQIADLDAPASDADPAARDAGPMAVTTPLAAEEPEEVLDLVDLAGGAVAKRAVPAAIAVLVIVFFVIRWLR